MKRLRLQLAKPQIDWLKEKWGIIWWTDGNKIVPFGSGVKDSLSDEQAASWFQTSKMNVMDWPTQYSDLNSKENLWGDLKILFLC